MTLDLENFTPFASLAGGALIGVASGLLWLGAGRIAGISGIFGGMLSGGKELPWRSAFVIAMVISGLLVSLLMPEWFTPAPGSRGPLVVAAAGLLVGFGTRLGSGCTSGHGICGLSRFSARSTVAVVTFMAAGFLTVLLTNGVLGG